MDIVDKATRSRMMSRIKGRDTKPELALRHALHALGFRYRVHARLPGRPDIVLPKYRAAVLVHGCFWHRHSECPMASIPSSNAQFWREKFDATVKRDARVTFELTRLGWRVATIWECRLKKDDLSLVTHRVARWLKSNSPSLEI